MSRGSHVALAVVWLLLLMSALCPLARADRLAEPKKRLSEARSAVTTAKVAVTLAARIIQREFEATAEWEEGCVRVEGSGGPP